MKYTLSEKQNDELTITITITQKEWESDLEEAYQKNKGKFKVEGFRAGKVPRAIIEKMYGKEVFYGRTDRRGRSSSRNRRRRGSLPEPRDPQAGGQRHL